MDNLTDDLFAMSDELRKKLDPEKLKRDIASQQSYEKTFNRAIYYTKTLDHSKKILELYDSIKKDKDKKEDSDRNVPRSASRPARWWED